MDDNQLGNIVMETTETISLTYTTATSEVTETTHSVADFTTTDIVSTNEPTTDIVSTNEPTTDIVSTNEPTNITGHSDDSHTKTVTEGNTEYAEQNTTTGVADMTLFSSSVATQIPSTFSKEPTTTYSEIGTTTVPTVISSGSPETHDGRSPEATHGKQHCFKTVGITVGVSAAVILLVVVVSVVFVCKMRKKWRKKIQDERLKTDIWSLSTFHNTIVNDNFMDYNLAPSGGNSNNRRKSLNYKSNNVQKPSRERLGRMTSLFDENNFTGDPQLRRNTFSYPNFITLSKSRVKQQDSSYSNDTSFDQSSEGRSRTSTFTLGRKVKNDLHVLVNHDELDTDDLCALHVDHSMPGAEFGVTEL